jgi:hypothetical protein
MTKLHYTTLYHAIPHTISPTTFLYPLHPTPPTHPPTHQSTHPQVPHFSTYLIPPQSAPVDPLTDHTTDARQWSLYVNHWARECARVGVWGRVSPAALLQFDLHRRYVIGDDG